VTVIGGGGRGLGVEIADVGAQSDGRITK